MALTKQQVHEAMKTGAVVVNVLEKEAFDDLHIKGSINIPLGKKTDNDFAGEVGRKVGMGYFIITHCTNVGCALGPRAAMILQARGFKAEDYPGGIEEWFNSGMPVEGNKAPSRAA